MLIDRRVHLAPELGVEVDVLDLRTPTLRIATFQARGAATDWGLLNRALGFAQTVTPRPALSLVLDGWARFEEAGRRRYLEPGELARSDLAKAGTEAFAGPTSHYFVVEWDAQAHGADFARPFEIERLDRRDVARVAGAARRMRGPSPERAVMDVVSVLRAAGLPLDGLDPGGLCADDDDELQRLQAVVSRSLSQLDAFPDIEELARALGWSQRRIHRRMSALRDRYRTPWTHWRGTLHHIRLIQSLRLLSAPGATTEAVARLVGFRAPGALCHAFAEAGLPSPGRLSGAARIDTLARWAELVP